MRKKISKTMMFSMIGVLAIVFLAPLSFAGAQYLNDEASSDGLGTLYKVFDSEDEYDNTYKLVNVIANTTVPVLVNDYFAVADCTFQPQSGIVYGVDGYNEVLISTTGAIAPKGDVIVFQTNYSAIDARQDGLSKIELVFKFTDEPTDLNLTVVNGGGATYNVQTSAGSSGFYYLDTATHMTARQGLTAESVTVDADGFCHVVIDIPETFVQKASLSLPADNNLGIAITLADGNYSLDGQVLTWTIKAYSDSVSPYTMMDTIAMILGGLFIVGAVFATPFVSTKGIRRR